MAPASNFTPKASLCDAPTNLKEAIDWVLRVTGRDGKALNKETECICGLAAAVTDLLQSVQLEYHGYEGESKGTDNSNGPPKEKVTERLNGLFSLVQGLGGTAVVRTYIDQLAQVLSALVGWSEIEKCWKGNSGECKVGANGYQHGKDRGCTYLQDVKHENTCDKCGCMKWEVKNPNTDGTPLGRRCQNCSEEVKKPCKCSGTGATCNSAGADACKCECTKATYRSAYRGIYNYQSYVEGTCTAYREATWKDMNTITTSRSKSAQILLGSVCLIWSGITYMYWTGKYAKGSPRWNNHILDGSGLDDGTLSQWLQALGFPREMLNNHGPGNRWDAIIWDGFRGMLYLGFPDTGNGGVHGHDNNANTFRDPAGMNYAGYIHTVDRGAFCSNATVFRKNDTTNITDEQMHKCGALYKLYILSCAYFTGLQKRRALSNTNTTTTPKTIREILYWLSALPYSQAYPKILEHSKGVLEKVAPDVGDRKQLSFYQTGRSAPITVHEYNLFAHFQAVTQYCPLVLIGIQGGLGKSTDKTLGPAIHALYSNSQCHFTYPTVSIQAYNQVVHYIRALFYQLYFLRKQCAVKVALGGKWRECRYGKDVVSKGVISWMCLGCDPMEHDRKCRVGKVKGELDGVVNKLKALEGIKAEGIKEVKDVLVTIGKVVVQLGNTQEALERKEKEEITKVKEALSKAKDALDKAKQELEQVKEEPNEKLYEPITKLGELTTNGGKGALDILANGNDAGSLQQIVGSGQEWEKDYSSAKDKISAVIHGLRYVVEALNKLAKQNEKNVECHVKGPYNNILMAIDHLQEICSTPKCSACDQHSTKCGKEGKPTICKTCNQQYMDGFPSPLQAFLEDRLPGFSCKEVLYTEDTDNYPPAASHLGHCNGSGQCCPLPMGFRGHFQGGSTSDCTGKRLYGILYFFSNENMMQSCVYTLVRVTAALSATTPQVLGDVFGFFRGGIGNKEQGKPQKGEEGKDVPCEHTGDPSESSEENKSKYFCGWCASGLRDEVKKIEWIPQVVSGKDYRKSVGKALMEIKGEKGSSGAPQPASQSTTNALSALTKDSEYLSPLTGELYTAVSATFGGTYLSWVLYLSDALQWGLESLSDAFQQIECRGCKGQCDPNKCKKGEHGQKSDTGSAGLCNCSSIVSCTGVLPVLYRHGFSYGNPFNLEGYHQKDGKTDGQYDIEDNRKNSTKMCHEFLESLGAVIDKNKQDQHPLTNLLSQVGQLQYDIRLPWIFVLTIAWLVAVLYLAFGAIWPLDWTHMRSHWLRGGEHQWQCMWYKVMTGRKGMELVEYFGRR